MKFCHYFFNSELKTLYSELISCISNVQTSRPNPLASTPNARESKLHEALEVSPNGLVPKPSLLLDAPNSQVSKQHLGRVAAHIPPLLVPAVLPLPREVDIL